MRKHLSLTPEKMTDFAEPPASINLSFKHLKSLIMFFVIILTTMLILQPQKAQASHFRYGHLTWQKVSGNTVRFTLVDAFRRSGYGAPNIGDTILESVGLTSLIFGDGQATPILKYVVIAVDVAEDWIIGRALDPNDPFKSTIDHTYATPDSAGLAPWTAEIYTNSRTSLEANNPLGFYRLLTYVETNSGNRSPSSGLPAIVTVKQGVASTFIVPGTDPDPNTTLVFRLATSLEAAGQNNFNQPPGLAINVNTGVVTWNTSTLQVDSPYSCQVVIEDRSSITNALRTQVAVDFLIKIVPCVNDLAPVFVAPSPACGSIINVTELQPLSFTVKTSDPDGGDIVELNTGGLPPGATATPVLPTAGNPTSTVINWTPLIGSAGNYVVIFTATDDCGVQTICSYTIHVTACNVVCNLGLSFTSTKTNCCNSCDGSLTANPSNGVGPFSYLWSNGQTTKCAVGLCKGSYTVTVTDSRGCTKKGFSNVGSPTVVKITIAQTNVKCKGSCNGILSASASGGSGSGYQYNWSNGKTTASINMLCKGTYTLTVTDSKGCTVSTARTITEPSKVLSVTTTKTTCSICFPNCNGTATANALGGTSPYTYLWSNGQTTKKITGLCAGTYTVTVTDKNRCAAQCTAVLSSTCCNIDLGNVIVVDNTNCTPCNGSITLSPTGGSGTYLFGYAGPNNITQNNLGLPQGPTASFLYLCAGVYTITVYDATNLSCFATESFEIFDDIEELPQLSSNIGENCPGGSTGTIEVLDLDGLDVTYLWSNGSTSNPLTDVPAGTYTVTVTGMNGCTATLQETISDKTPPNIMPFFIDCHNACTGGGLVLNDIDYSNFEWSNGSMSELAINLCAGATTLSVTDFDGCKQTVDLILDNPDALIAACSLISDESAPGAFDGSLQGSAIGGTQGVGYYLLWSDGQNTDVCSGLTAGTYTLTCTDKNGCTATTSCNVVTTGPTVKVNSGCNFACCSASIEIHGLLPNQFDSIHWELDPIIDDYDQSCFNATLIDIINTDTTLTDVCSGSYFITIYLSTGGELSYSGLVYAGTINPSIRPFSASCYGICDGDILVENQYVSLTSILEPNGNPLVGGMCPDTVYAVTVTDNFGCTTALNYSIWGPSPIIANCSTVQNPSTNMSQDGILEVDLCCSPDYSYLWSNGATTRTVTGLGIGNYTVTVTDNLSSGCTATTSCNLSCNNRIMSTNSFAEQTSSIYPNPFSEGFIIKYSGDDEFKLTVSDLRGRVVIASSGLTKQAQMGNDLAPGIYMIHLESADGYRSYEKIIKTK